MEFMLFEVSWDFLQIESSQEQWDELVIASYYFNFSLHLSSSSSLVGMMIFHLIKEGGCEGYTVIVLV